MAAIIKRDEKGLEKVFELVTARVEGNPHPTPGDLQAYALLRFMREGVPGRETTIDNDRKKVEEDIINFLIEKYGVNSENAMNFPSDKIIREDNLPTHEQILSGATVQIDDELKSRYWEPFFEDKNRNVFFGSEGRVRILQKVIP